MLSRRGFLGALTALVTAPLALAIAVRSRIPWWNGAVVPGLSFSEGAQTPLTTLDLSGVVDVADIRWAETMPPLGKVKGTLIGYWDPLPETEPRHDRRRSFLRHHPRRIQFHAALWFVRGVAPAEDLPVRIK